MKNKHLQKIDLVLIVGTLTALIFLAGYARPLVIAPPDNYKTPQTNILFSIEKADTLLIDDNIGFTTPDEYQIKDGLKINLKPGKYYWKVAGVLKSEIRTLTITSEVNLELKKMGENYGVINAGNVRLNVDVYNGTELVDKINLDVGNLTKSDGNKFVGGME